MEPRRLHPQGTNQHVGILAIGIEDPRIRSQILRFFHSIAEQGVVIAIRLSRLTTTCSCVLRTASRRRLLRVRCRNHAGQPRGFAPGHSFGGCLRHSSPFADDRQPALSAGSLPAARLQVVDLLLENLDLDLEPCQLAHDAAQGQVEVGRDIHAQAKRNG